MHPPFYVTVPAQESASYFLCGKSPADYRNIFRQDIRLTKYAFPPTYNERAAKTVLPGAK